MHRLENQERDAQSSPANIFHHDIDFSSPDAKQAFHHHGHHGGHHCRPEQQMSEQQLEHFFDQVRPIEQVMREITRLEERLVEDLKELMARMPGQATDRPPAPGQPPASDRPAQPTANPPAGAPAGGGDVPPPPARGGNDTPANAAQALDGFTPPTDLKDPVITPTFGGGKSDTQAIQEAVNKAAADGGGVVHIPPGTYNIDAANAGIIMKDNVTLLMDKGTTLKAIASGAENGCIIDVRNVNNVNIYGGKLVGDFGPGASHSGECMSGIDVLGTSSNIDIQGVESDYNKGDGFDIQGSGKNIHLAHNVALGNKRDGLSIEGGSNIVAEYNAFLQSGTADSYDNEVPEASRLPVSGIDIENSSGNSVDQVIIRNNLLADNGNTNIDADTSNGWGIRVTGSAGKNSQVLDNTITGNAAGGVGVWSGTGNIVSGNVLSKQPHAYQRFGGEASGSDNSLDGVPLDIAF